MKWLDIYDISIALEEKFPNQDVININFVKLKDMITQLSNFQDNENSCNEKILEAIQAAWLDERS